MRAAYRATKPSECWDWLSPTDIIRLAAQAYARAKHECRPPRGQAFTEAGEPWSSPADFCESLTRLLVLHVQAQAHGAGIEGYELTPAQLSRWYADSGAGRSPAVMGHGWPASSAGPGPGRPVPGSVQAPSTETAVPSPMEAQS